MIGDRRCPTGCGRWVSPGHLLCGRCWARVPKDVQQLVNRTWTAWRANLDNPTKYGAYQDAADLAITAAHSGRRR